MHVKDLNLTTDILNLFDFTLNDEARAGLRKMIATPLAGKQQVIERQEILKGFIANMGTLEKYSYSRIDFREAFTFIDTFSTKYYLPKRLTLKLWLSKRRRYEYRGKCVQLVLLYHRLHHHYISKLDLAAFPEAYKQDIRFMDGYLNSFRTQFYENLIHTDGFRVKHLVQLIKLIAEKKHRHETEEFRAIYTRFEAFLSAATGIKRHRMNFPEITDGKFGLRGFYHPLLPRPVKNSFEAKSNVVLLTGPNMSGKSTLLKAISLCTWLGNLGFAIPAAGGSLPFYGSVSVFINLNDDLQSGYSHFMAEVMNLKSVVAQAREGIRCMGIFDELFRGTNIDDALEISRATIKGLLNFPDSIFFISSHLHELTEMAEVQGGLVDCCYLDCRLDGNMPAFTYKLKKGWSDIRIGRILFEKEGLNEMLGNN